MVGTLLIGATVSWRPDSLYAGGVDSVVAAKALLSFAALAIVWTARSRCDAPNHVGNRSIWVLAAYLVIATFGAWSTGDVSASAVLAIRVVVLATALVLLVATFSWDEVVKGLLGGAAAVTLVAGVSGVPTYVANGRLGGGVPPLNPNELGTLAGVLAVGILVAVLQRTSRHSRAAAFAVAGLVATVWLTGSRTALMGMIVGFVVVTLQARRLSPSVSIVLVAMTSATIYIGLFTERLTAFLGRGGAENLTTLSSRTIAWTAAFDFPTTEWIRWMGAGLSTKEIPVDGQYWDTQLLDSSWISALVQAGYVGVIVLALLVVSTVLSAFRRPRPMRILITGLATFLVVRSVLESGLVDSTPTFLVFFTIALIADPATGPRVAFDVGDLSDAQRCEWAPSVSGR